MKNLIFTIILACSGYVSYSQSPVGYYINVDENDGNTWEKKTIEYYAFGPQAYPIYTLNDTASWYFYTDTINFAYVDQFVLKGNTNQYVRGDGSIVSFPTIPSNTNQLINGAGFLVSADIAGKLSISDTTSMLAPYMRINNAYTKTQSDSRYYLLSDTFPSGKVMTSNAANNAISGINNDLNGKAAKATTLTINGVAFDLSANRTWSNVGIELPSQTGQAGKALITNGSTVSWGTVLTAEVDGSTTNEIELPSQTGNAGKVLQTNGSSVSWVTPSNAPGTNYYTSYSAGTGYNITTTPAKIDFTGGGSVDPSITLGAAGTYVITSNVRIDYNGLTNVAANTVTVKLRRINNTAADLADATGGFTVPPVTLLTSTGGDCDVNTVIYTTANNNDVIELWASRSASISVGNIVAGNAWIVAHRIY